MAKLIFYSTVGPDEDDRAWSVFSLARRAVEASIEAEIFLAGPATGLVRRQVRDRTEGRQKEALELVLSAKTPISLAPG